MTQTSQQASQQSTTRASKTYRVTGLHFRFSTADGTPAIWAVLVRRAVDAASRTHGAVSVSVTRRWRRGYQVTVDVAWIEATGSSIAQLAATFS